MTKVRASKISSRARRSIEAALERSVHGLPKPTTVAAMHALVTAAMRRPVARSARPAYAGACRRALAHTDAPDELDAELAQRFSELTDLADEGVGGRAIFATDEWFAVAQNMLKPTPAVFDPDAFCEQGKVMDGWETRRRRTAGHDWAIVRLGLPGYVHGLEIDTAHFTGNQVPAVRVLGAEVGAAVDDDAWLGAGARDTLGVQGSASSAEQIGAAEAACAAAAEWHELLPISPLRPGYGADTGESVHRFRVPRGLATKRITHLRVNQHPDGGIARVRAWGVAAVDFHKALDPAAVGRVDLLSAMLGARALGCSNRHYGEPRNLLRPGRGENMGAGWETARNPGRPAVMEVDAQTGFVKMPGVCDWSVLRLAAVAKSIDEFVIDTNHFRGNYPESVLIEACDAPSARTADLLGSGRGAVEWRTLLPRTRVGPSAEHRFKSGAAFDGAAIGRVTHVRVSIFPDGGLMRVRALGEAAEPMPSPEPED